jgi:PAS domain S-box-containing protein
MSERIYKTLLTLGDDEALKQSEKEAKKLSMAIENSPSSVFITNVNGKIEYVNPKFTEITGYEPEEIVGKNPSILKSGTKTAEEYKILWDTISSGKTWYGEFYNKKKNGELYWESASIASITDPYGNITNYVAVKEDITEKKKMEEELTKLATTDPLTGVANRRFFAERMESELVRFKRFGNPASFLMLDSRLFQKNQRLLRARYRRCSPKRVCQNR